MTQELKRSPGRPPKNTMVEEMIEPEALKSAPITRGMREASIRSEEIKRRMREEESNYEFHDDFHIDQRLIPEGWDYNWKRKVTAGMSDPAYEVELAQSGWEPVESSRHPHMMPGGHVGPVERRGMILMERPKEISDMGKQRELVNAREAVAARERALGMTPSGTLERDRNRTTLNKQYVPMEIPRG